MKIKLKPNTCKYCGSDTVIKFGRYKKQQRYFCNLCHRKYRAESSPFHMKAPAAYVISSLVMYFDGFNLKSIREYLKQKYSANIYESVIYYWLKKYAQRAIDHFSYYQPQVGDEWIVWIADQIILEMGSQRRVCIYDVMDTKTRFLLASIVSDSFQNEEIETLINRATLRAGKYPSVITNDGHYLKWTEEAIKINDKVWTVQKNQSTSDFGLELMERFHGRLDLDLKRTHLFRSKLTLNRFVQGWSVYYNYFKHYSHLADKSPAEAAHIKYKITDWAGLVMTNDL